jgi:hypothetical protein
MPASIHCTAPTPASPLVSCPTCASTTWWQNVSTPFTATCHGCQPAAPEPGQTIRLVQYGRYARQPTILETLGEVTR